MSKKTMQHNGEGFLILTASSFDPRSKIGVGGHLILTVEECRTQKETEFDKLSVSTKNFQEIPGKRVEMESLIWGIEIFDERSSASKLSVFSDCRASKDLLKRREKLELTNFAGVREGTFVANSDLLQKFFELHDRLGFEVTWMEPSAINADKTSLQLLFAEVCKQTQEVLNERLKKLNPIESKWF